MFIRVYKRISRALWNIFINSIVYLFQDSINASDCTYARARALWSRHAHTHAADVTRLVGDSRASSQRSRANETNAKQARACEKDGDCVVRFPRFYFCRAALVWSRVTFTCVRTRTQLHMYACARASNASDIESQLVGKLVKLASSKVECKERVSTKKK